ncbi:hypothetical protein [Pararhizobium sp. PWRC1-1]|uniref:hypothetical protein n=1 Tax=Pararhizobium sp. PWRC1-1 TaxID=2804566 RepID=UPI003CF7BF45
MDKIERIGIGSAAQNAQDTPVSRADAQSRQKNKCGNRNYDSERLKGVHHLQRRMISCKPWYEYQPVS